MEQENKKERELARREYVSDIRELVEFVRGRDPRWTALRIKQKQDEQAKAEQAERTKREAEIARIAQKQLFQEEVSGSSIVVVHVSNVFVCLCASFVAACLLSPYGAAFPFNGEKVMR